MHPNIRAAIWMIGAIVSFSVMAIAGREASAELDTFEIMMYRSFVGLATVCLILSVSRNWHMVTLENLGLHAARNLAHFGGQNLWFFALTAMPLAQLFALEFTTPIWVLLLSPVLLKAPIRPVGLLAAGIAFVGILIVARPGSAPIGIGFGAAALCAVFFALTFIATKKLTQRNSTASILFYLTLMQAVFGIVFAGHDFDVALPSFAVVPYVVIIGLAGLVAHFCITNALKIAPASVVAPIDFIRLPAIAIVGALVYDEVIDVWVILGAIIIFSANYLNIISEMKHSQDLTKG